MSVKMDKALLFDGRSFSYVNYVSGETMSSLDGVHATLTTSVVG